MKKSKHRRRRTLESRKPACNGLSYIKVDCEVEIVGNKWDNPELLEVD